MGSKGQDRGRRRGQREAKKPKSARPTIHLEHPRFGKIPLVPSDGPGAYEWDPTYAPPLPRGAVRGNITKHVYGLSVPLYFYEDLDRTCVQCGEDFVFAAKEQKFWYEALGFLQASTPIRCVTCRRKKRSALALERALSEARTRARETPDDPLAHLAVAESLCTYHVSSGKGRLDDGVASAREAYLLDPLLHEALFWEAACHDAAGRVAKARDGYARFLARADNLPRCRALVKRARTRVD